MARPKLNKMQKGYLEFLSRKDIELIADTVGCSISTIYHAIVNTNPKEGTKQKMAKNMFEHMAVMRHTEHYTYLSLFGVTKENAKNEGIKEGIQYGGNIADIQG